MLVEPVGRVRDRALVIRRRVRELGEGGEDLFICGGFELRPEFSV